MLISKIKDLHPTAQVYRVKHGCNLFLVYYNGLTLALSYTTLIGFCVGDKWHLSTEKVSKNTDKHKHLLISLVKISFWYPVRNEMLRAFKVAIK
jgi:hypothetical protein